MISFPLGPSNPQLREDVNDLTPKSDFLELNEINNTILNPEYVDSQMKIHKLKQ